jgi:hypothetical protein
MLIKTTWQRRFAASHLQLRPPVPLLLSGPLYLPFNSPFKRDNKDSKFAYNPAKSCDCRVKACKSALILLFSS